MWKLTASTLTVTNIPFKLLLQKRYETGFAWSWTRLMWSCFCTSCLALRNRVDSVYWTSVFLFAFTGKRTPSRFHAAPADSQRRAQREFGEMVHLKFRTAPSATWCVCVCVEEIGTVKFSAYYMTLPQISQSVTRFVAPELNSTPTRLHKAITTAHAARVR